MKYLMGSTSGPDAAAIAAANPSGQTLEVYAPYPGQAFQVKGLQTNPGQNGSAASGVPKVRAARLVAPFTANAALDAREIGGFNVETFNRVLYFSASQKWTVYTYFSTNAATTFRGAATLGTSNPTDTDAVATNSLGCRLRPGVNAAFFGYSTNATPTTFPVAMGGVVPAVDTNYVVRTVWDGTTASVSIATISADGVVGAYSTAATFTGAQLPASNIPVTPTQKWWNNGATQPTVDVGGAVVRPG